MLLQRSNTYISDKREYLATKTDHRRGLKATFCIKLWCKMDITLVKISPSPSKFSKIMSTKELIKTFSSQILLKCKHCYFCIWTLLAAWH